MLTFTCPVSGCLIFGNVGQIESTLQTQKLKPTIDAIKRQYGDDKERVQRETSALYEESGVNPLAGAPVVASPLCHGLLNWPYLRSSLRGTRVQVADKTLSGPVNRHVCSYFGGVCPQLLFTTCLL